MYLTSFIYMTFECLGDAVLACATITVKFDFELDLIFVCSANVCLYKKSILSFYCSM